MCLQVALLVVSFKLNWNLDMVCTPLQVVILLHLAWGIGYAAHQWIELTKEGLPPTLQLLPGYGTRVKKSTQHICKNRRKGAMKGATFSRHTANWLDEYSSE
jgi:hypothetical protein